MDMRFHWFRDRECQEQFRIYWRPGHSNYADYWTKHHSAKHHQNIRREFITPLVVLEMLRQDCLSPRPAAPPLNLTFFLHSFPFELRKV
eukprot:CCRYP_002920-RA/>CCRYP_002920-RA protein AED:0.48 eAED:0.48 QI:0/-1/0/1/-1/0/1/0/88